MSRQTRELRRAAGGRIDFCFADEFRAQGGIAEALQEMLELGKLLPIKGSFA